MAVSDGKSLVFGSKKTKSLMAKAEYGSMKTMSLKAKAKCGSMKTASKAKA